MPTPELVSQGELRWYDFGTAIGSEPQGRRPAVVIQGDELNHSRLRTTVIAAVTSRTSVASLPGAVFIPAGITGTSRDSVVQLWALHTVNKWEVGPVEGVVPAAIWKSIQKGVAEMMGRPG